MDLFIQSDIFTQSDIFRRRKCIFNIYEGPRWPFPEGIKASKSIKHKFSLLETTFNIRKLNGQISNHIATTGFKFKGSSVNYTSPYYLNEIREWKIVKKIYSKLNNFRRNLLGLIFKWRIRKCLNNIKNVEDPATLEVPVKPVYIIDVKNRNTFVFEASTLRKTFDNRIFISDYMFPLPSDPVNILTNQKFTIGQMISIVKQCKKYGISSWAFESLIDVGYDFEMFLTRNKQTLKVKAIESFFTRQSIFIRETILDFFNLKAQDMDISDRIIKEFTNTYDDTPEMPVIKCFIKIVKDYYIAVELNSPTMFVKLSNEIADFYDSLYQIFSKR